MTRRKRSGCERDALTRDCPTCNVPQGDWCEGRTPHAPLHLSRHTLLTTLEASRFLGVGYLSVIRYVKAGALVGRQDRGSGRWVVDARSVEAYLARMTQEATV